MANPPSRIPDTAPRPQINCEHCGTPFTPIREEQKYCCTGCEYVSALIRNENLDHFYELKNEPISPVQARSFEIRNYDWLTELQKNSIADSRKIVRLELAIEGISCFGCVWLIEKLFERKPGAGEITLSPATGMLTLRIHQDDFDAASFAHEIQKFGYLLAPRGKAIHQESGRLRGRLGLCAAFAMNNMLFSLPFYLGMSHQGEFAGLFHILIVLLATLSMAVGGSYFIQRAIQGFRLGMLHMDLPISMGICAAYVGSLVGLFLQQETLLYFDFVSIFIFLMLLGRWIQEVNVEKNQNRLLKLSLRPTKIIRIKETSSDLIPIDQIQPSDTLEIRPGEMIPVAGSLLSESASFNLAWILGESDLREMKKGQTAPSGATFIGKNPIHLRALESWQESLLHRLVSEQNVDKKFEPRILQLTLKYYILTVIILAFLSAFYWWLVRHDLIQALQVFVSLLVVSCPCALGLSYPLINEISVLSLQKIGLFIRNNLLWSKLPKIKKIIFDKTGTLTLETPILQNPDSLQQLSTAHQRTLFEMVSSSFHPVSRSLREELLRIHPDWLPEKNTAPEEIPGLGLRFPDNHQLWTLGRSGWVGNITTESPTANLAKSCEFRLNQQVIASFSFADTLKQDAEREIPLLLKSGFEIFILSGDTQKKLNHIMERLNLPRETGFAEMSPDEKASWIAQHAPHDALMVGDGANDSLAFNQALCTGTPVIHKNLLEQKSDFYFVGNSLAGIRTLFETSRVRIQAIRNVFIFAIAYNIAAGSLCVMGMMNPFAATVFMPLSSVASLALATYSMKKTLS